MDTLAKVQTLKPEPYTLNLRSKDPNKRVLGPKYYNINGIWDLKPIIWVLGPLG